MGVSGTFFEKAAGLIPEDDDDKETPKISPRRRRFTHLRMLEDPNMLLAAVPWNERFVTSPTPSSHSEGNNSSLSRTKEHRGPRLFHWCPPISVDKLPILCPILTYCILLRLSGGSARQDPALSRTLAPLATDFRRLQAVKEGFVVEIT
eukprot:2023823-Rhodomonas_salina.3